MAIRIVHVVRPEDPAEDVLVFAREQDAESYSRARWGSAWPDIETATVIDPELAAQMITEQEDGEPYPEPKLIWDEDRAEEGYDCPCCEAWVPAHRQFCADCGLDTARLAGPVGE